VKVKLPKEMLEDFHPTQWELQSYDETFHEAVLKPLQPDAPDFEEIEEILIRAYHRIASGR